MKNFKDALSKFFLLFLTSFVLFTIGCNYPAAESKPAGSSLVLATAVVKTAASSTAEIVPSVSKPTVTTTTTTTTTTRRRTTTTTRPTTPPQDGRVSLGYYVITAYCPCRICSEGWGHQTATGVRATEGRTIAVDPRVIPYGSKVEINGRIYIAEDCGAAIKQKKIDIFFESHEAAERWGRRTLEVFLITE